MLLALSFVVMLAACWLKLWATYRLWNLYPARNFLSDERGRRLFWIGKITPLFIALGVVGAAWCTNIWWVFAWACVFYAGVVLLVIFATRHQLKVFGAQPAP